jgi:hypothetical protein
VQTHLGPRLEPTESDSGLRRQGADGGSARSSVGVRKEQRARERKRGVSATSQEQREDRQVAHGDKHAKQRRIGFDPDLVGGFRREQGDGRLWDLVGDLARVGVSI